MNMSLRHVQENDSDMVQNAALEDATIFNIIDVSTRYLYIMHTIVVLWRKLDMIREYMDTEHS